MVERADHAVEEGLAADEVVIGAHPRLAGKMLARAEADLDFECSVVAEQRARIERAGLGHAHLRQQRLDERGLALAELVSLRTAIEAASGSRIGHAAC